MNIRNLGHLAVDNAPHILTYLAVGGVVSTVFLAVKATPAAVNAIEQVETEAQDEGVLNDDGSTFVASKGEAFKAAWKFYIPAAVAGGATIGCIIASNTVNTRRRAAIVAGYSLLQRSYQEYQEKTIEKIGPKKDEEIRAEIAHDQLEKKDAANELLIVDDGEVLCYDRYSGRAFKSDIESIRKAENDINAGINNFMYASLNDFYRRVGLKGNDAGELVGFNNDHMLSIAFSSTLVSGKPAVCIDFHNAPVPDFHKFW